jgi:hypothetical protein
MPELDWYWGYFLCLGTMLLISGIQVYIFWKKGWFRNVLFTTAFSISIWDKIGTVSKAG